eukprot:5920561-Amphidinium_carterae.2
MLVCQLEKDVPMWTQHIFKRGSRSSTISWWAAPKAGVMPFFPRGLNLATNFQVQEHLQDRVAKERWQQAR